MARYLDMHPVNPQERLIRQAVDVVREGGLIAYPTDSGYALGCRLDQVSGKERIVSIRRLTDKHHFSLMCADFSQLGQFVHVSNAVFRAVKAATPGPYTFVLPATPEVPRRLMHPKKHTVGVRISPTPVVQALLTELGEAMLTTTLILPDHDEPMMNGWEVKDELDHLVDVVIDTGECGAEPTTVVDLSSGVAEILRYGAGDASRFEED
ncbi:L-threonylcarbamoyladenylate synthase [Austwickia chelonae]|uniref:L-threonylcarbamoyladenylate synthase n=1 Tax=Austwickia chelonae TaxID=100225 RepID=UPI000E26B483|nr:L-threonylcarbamoyladenylate synthase [Austwickia chelonae]